MNICVVIVTYNRLQKLQKALQSYETQTVLPYSIIVVNNCSTDGTSDFLTQWCAKDSHISRKTVINLDVNTGGAGGFYVGMKRALDTNADWIWVSDDDAYPDKDALYHVQQYAETHSRYTACICGAVYLNGVIDIDHRRISKNRLIKMPYKLPKDCYSKQDILIEDTTFVGSCFNAEVVRKAGLPIKDFFIYFDDTEYSHRIRHYGNIVLLPDIKITHDTITYAQPTNVIATWRDYYLIRNHIYTLRRHHLPSFFAYCIKKIYDTLTIYIKNGHKQQLKLNFTAISHGITGHLGIHHIYKPGYNLYAQ